MTVRYFAYGSNMSIRRLRARVPSAHLICTAELRGYRLAFHKRGLDGSGKCMVMPSTRPHAVVHGVVFRILRVEKPALDAAEMLGVGYEERGVELHTTAGIITVQMYEAKASHIDPALQPFDWYKAFVVTGAREHGLPHWYVAAVERVTSDPDPNTSRARQHRRLLRP